MFRKFLLVTLVVLGTSLFMRGETDRVKSAWTAASEAADPVINFCRDNPGLCQTAQTGYRHMTRALEIGAGLVSGHGELVYVQKNSGGLLFGATGAAMGGTLAPAALGTTYWSTQSPNTSWVSSSEADRVRSNGLDANTCR